MFTKCFMSSVMSCCRFFADNSFLKQKHEKREKKTLSKRRFNEFLNSLQRICPSGSYHDPIRDRCRAVPGGGNLIKFNFDARCSGAFRGLLAHSQKSRYYFVCKRSSVLTCTCSPKEHFSRVRLRCESRSNQLTKHEERSHQAVENIMSKYKCVYQQDDRSFDGSFQPEMTFRSVEVVNYDPVSSSYS